MPTGLDHVRPLQLVRLPVRLQGRRSFAEITKPFYDWTAAHAPSKPLMLAEYGVQEQAGGLAQQGRLVPRLAGPAQDRPDPDQGQVYFNNLHNCDWRISSWSSSVAAYREIGRDGFLNRLQ